MEEHMQSSNHIENKNTNFLREIKQKFSYLERLSNLSCKESRVFLDLLDYAVPNPINSVVLASRGWTGSSNKNDDLLIHLDPNNSIRTSLR